MGNSFHADHLSYKLLNLGSADLPEDKIRQERGKCLYWVITRSSKSSIIFKFLNASKTLKFKAIINSMNCYQVLHKNRLE